MLKEIVIAAYDKPTDWVSMLNDNIKRTIYRKGNVKPLGDNEILIEPNLGRCVHTFFNHIYSNYYNLSDYTFFVQDYPFDHWGDIIEVINNDSTQLSSTASLTIGGYYGYHNNKLGSAWNLSLSQQFGSGKVLVCLSDGRPQDIDNSIDVDKYWDILFNEPKPLTYEFIPGGHFAITKEHVHLRSRDFYKKITDLLIEDSSSPWMIERLECYIFNPNYKSK